MDILEISDWLFTFSLFFFLSLALIKRYSEILLADSKKKVSGRGYFTEDADQIARLGSACGLISILVFTLYLTSPQVTILYQNPRVLWFATPMLLYWISRIWFLAERKQLPDDPVVFAVKDRVSYLIGAALTIIFLIAKG